MMKHTDDFKREAVRIALQLPATAGRPHNRRYPPTARSTV